MVEANKRVALKNVKVLWKLFSFTTEMLKGALAEGRDENEYRWS